MEPPYWTEIYIETQDKNRILAKDSNGHSFYARNARGSELYPVIDDEPVYRRDSEGRPRYPKNQLGNEFYYEDDHGIKPLYDGAIPVYARNSEGKVLFPEEFGREFYLRHKRTREHHTEGLDRYAFHSREDTEVYPKKNCDDNGACYEALIDNRYAKNKEDDEYYYPLDCFGNEYYVRWTPSLKEGDVIVDDRYALSVRGYYIVPEKDGEAYLTLVIWPSIYKKNVTEQVDRGFERARDYLTNVQSHQRPNRVCRKWVEKYIRTEDPDRIFARDSSGNVFYARNAEGDELYPVLDGRSVFLKDADGRQHYAKNRYGDEFYFADPETNKPVPLTDSDGRPVYARSLSGDEVYPMYNRDEIPFIHGDVPVYAEKRNGEFFYPKDRLGNEYASNSYYIRHSSTVVYPLAVDGRPIYPKDEDGKQYYVFADGKYHIARDGEGNQRYARTQDGDDFYPPDLSIAHLQDGVTPVYAKTSRGKILFPQKNGSEFYIRDLRNLDDYTEGVDRYARDHEVGIEFYPRKKGNGSCSYDALIDNRYALEIPPDYYYPRDCYDNEYYVQWTPSSKEEDVFLNGRYAVSKDGYFIVPEKDGRPHISTAVGLFVHPDNITGKIERGFDEKYDYLTNLWARDDSPTATIPREEPKKKTVTGSPFYRAWVFVILLIVLSVIGLTFYMRFQNLSRGIGMEFNKWVG